VARFLETEGGYEIPADADADSFKAYLDKLQARVRDKQEALAEVRASERQIERIQGEQRRTSEAVEAIFSRVKLEKADEEELRVRLTRLDDWKSLTDSRIERAAVEGEGRRELGSETDLLRLVDTEDEERLLREKEILEETAAKRDELADEITRIETLIASAQRGRQLERLEAERQVAEDALRAKYAEALMASAGTYILETIESEYVESTRPAALRQAEDWFSRFTYGQFELAFDGGTVAAVETTTGERRLLSELSSGTRTQLLLALRVAFALQMERGAVGLPFLLDEALTTADPERFRAAAEALHMFAEQEDRQVFYLTAKPEDVAYWQEHDSSVKVVDLAEFRGMARAFQEGADLRLPARARIPTPDGMTVEEYGVLVGASPVDLNSGSGAIHLFHLLRDDLGLLRQLLELGVANCGSLRSLLKSSALESVFDESTLRRLEGRVSAADEWFECRCQGTAKTVCRADLAECSSISAAFQDKVSAVCDEVDGDPRRLVEALRDGQVARFRSAATDGVEEWLVEEGYVDNRPVLERPAILVRVASVLSTTDALEGAMEEASFLVDSLEISLVE
jgi:exonuclease SbcC